DVCRAIGELRIRTYATSNLGMVFLWYGRIDEAREFFDESLRISKSCNDRLARADALCEHSRLFLTTGEYDRAIETARSCIDLYHEMGREKVSLPSIVLGKALRLKRANGAYEALNEGLEAARSVNHQPDIAYGLEGLGSLALDQQDYDQAEDCFRQALEIWTKIGSEPEIAKILCRIAHTSLTSGSNDSPRIREQFGQALRLAHKHQSGMVAIPAMVGLEALKIREGDPGSAGPLLLFASQHQATPHEVKVWVDAMIQKIGTGPDTWASTLSWQQLADDYERSL
ncbi:MAG: tetratricopeptide repeat protein, partial [Chloroflexi bacterium]